MIEEVMSFSQSMSIQDTGILLVIVAAITTLSYTLGRILSSLKNIFVKPFQSVFIRRISANTGDHLYYEIEEWLSMKESDFYFNRNFKVVQNLNSYSDDDEDIYVDGESINVYKNISRMKLSTGYGVCFLKTKGFPIMRISRSKRDSNSHEQQDIIDISFFSPSDACVFNFMEELKEISLKKVDDGPFTYKFDSHYWGKSELIKWVYRPTGKSGKKFIEDVSKFVDDAPLYKKKNVPHKRGFLLYGEPGTGKTSLVAYVAALLNRDIYIMDDLTSSKIAKMISRVPSGSILLLDDVDRTSIAKRSSGKKKNKDNSDVDESVSLDDENDNDDVSNDIFGEMADSFAKSSLKALMFEIDGICAKDMLIISTANDLTKIDDALIRKGRIGALYEVGKLDSQEQIEHIKNFFEGDDIDLDGVVFPNRTFAELQDTLVINIENPNLAIDQLKNESEPDPAPQIEENNDEARPIISNKIRVV